MQSVGGRLQISAAVAPDFPDSARTRSASDGQLTEPPAGQLQAFREGQSLEMMPGDKSLGLPPHNSGPRVRYSGDGCGLAAAAFAQLRFCIHDTSVSP